MAEAGAEDIPSRVVFPLKPVVESWVESMPVAFRF
jgi:hypothetical protein